MDTIGFIGLGIMGKPMAVNLLNAGYPLVLNTRTRSKADELLRNGALWADNTHAVAEKCNVVITMLPDSPDVEKVAADVLSRTHPGMMFIDMSTILPEVARRIARDAQIAGVEFLDAPVSGGETGAMNASLSIMVGGSEAAFARAMPILQTMGKNIVRIGESGAGQIAKAANQIIVALTIEAVSEALTLATKAGVDPVQVRRALLGGFAQSRVLDAHGKRILDRNFTPGFRTRLHYKDLLIALQTGKQFGAALPNTEHVREMMADLIAGGGGDLDHVSLVKWIEEKSK